MKTERIPLKRDDATDDAMKIYRWYQNKNAPQKRSIIFYVRV
jgi:hypothetical protein